MTGRSLYIWWPVGVRVFLGFFVLVFFLVVRRGRISVSYACIRNWLIDSYI
jgi:hypothetical protein